MNILQSIGIIAGSAGAIFLIIKIYGRKVKRLNDQIGGLQQENSSLQNKIDQQNREHAAGISHTERVNTIQTESNDIQKRASKAKSSDEIMSVLNDIDSENNSIARGK